MIRTLLVWALWAGLAAVGIFLLATPAGLSWLWGQLRSSLPPGIHVAEVEGRLTGPIRLRGVEYHTDTFDMTLRQAELEWSPLHLLLGTLTVDKLHLQGLRYTGKEKQPESTPPPAPPTAGLDLPFNVDLRDFRVDDLRYRASQGAKPHIIDHFALQASYDVAGLTLKHFRLESPLVTASGQGSRLSPARASGEAEDQGIVHTLAATAHLREPRFGRVQVNLDASLHGQALVIRALHLTTPAQPGTSLLARGALNFAPEHPILALQTEWEGVRLPPNHPQAISEKGQLHLFGPLNNYSLALKAALKRPGQPNGNLTLHGKGNRGSFQLAQLALQTQDGTLAGSGRASWQPALEAALQLRGQGLNPEGLLPGWPGQLDLRLRAQGGMVAGAPQVQVEEVRVQGDLRGHDLRLDARGSYRDRSLQLEQAQLHSGPTTLSLQGDVGASWDLAWELTSNDLGSLVPTAKGRLQGEGTVTGPRAWPRIQATLTGHGIAFRDYKLEQLALDTRLDPQGEVASHLRFHLKEGQLPGLALHSLSLEGQGKPASHTLRLALDSGMGSAEMELEGAFREALSEWGFRLTRGELQLAQSDPLGEARDMTWRLSQPISGEVAADRISFQRGCWQSEAARLCLQGSRSEQQQKAQITLEHLPLAYLQGLLPPETQLEGTVSGHATWAQIDGETPRAQLRLTTSNGRILQETTPIMTLQAGHVHLAWDPGGLGGEVTLALADGGKLKLQARVQPGEQALTQRPLAGQLRADLPDLAFVQPFLTQVEGFQGRLNGELALSGSLADPYLEGALRVQETALTLPQLGIRITEASLVLESTNGRELRLRGQARSGGGTLALRVVATPFVEPLELEAQIEGDAFQVADTHELQVFISPELQATVQDHRIEVEGEVQVPQAAITFDRIPESGAVTVSPDQVIVRPSQSADGAAPLPWQIASRVRLVLGDNVRFEGFGLKTRFAGSLLIRDRPGQLMTTASGAIRLEEGHYRAYGQNLEIQTGRVLFGGGPISDPGIDLRAVRQPAPEVTVGVKAQGRLRQPELSLFSEPPMEQTEQLSWLVLGRPPGKAFGASEGSALTRAALAMGLKGGDFLAKKLGSQLGIDEVQVQSQPSETGGTQASLVLGKYLSPGLYISYGIGLLESTSTLYLRYTLSQNWSLETESSSNQTGIDLLYTIETGQ